MREERVTTSKGMRRRKTTPAEDENNSNSSRSSSQRVRRGPTRHSSSFFTAACRTPRESEKELLPVAPFSSFPSLLSPPHTSSVRLSTAPMSSSSSQPMDGGGGQEEDEHHRPLPSSIASSSSSFAASFSISPSSSRGGGSRAIPIFLSSSSCGGGGRWTRTTMTAAGAVAASSLRRLPVPIQHALNGWMGKYTRHYPFRKIEWLTVKGHVTWCGVFWNVPPPHLGGPGKEDSSATVAAQGAEPHTLEVGTTAAAAAVVTLSRRCIKIVTANVIQGVLLFWIRSSEEGWLPPSSSSSSSPPPSPWITPSSSLVVTGAPPDGPPVQSFPTERGGGGGGTATAATGASTRLLFPRPSHLLPPGAGSPSGVSSSSGAYSPSSPSPFSSPVSPCPLWVGPASSAASASGSSLPPFLFIRYALGSHHWTTCTAIAGGTLAQRKMGVAFAAIRRHLQVLLESDGLVQCVTLPTSFFPSATSSSPRTRPLPIGSGGGGAPVSSSATAAVVSSMESFLHQVHKGGSYGIGAVPSFFSLTGETSPSSMRDAAAALGKRAPKEVGSTKMGMGRGNSLAVDPALRKSGEEAPRCFPSPPLPSPSSPSVGTWVPLSFASTAVEHGYFLLHPTFQPPASSLWTSSTSTSSSSATLPTYTLFSSLMEVRQHRQASKEAAAELLAAGGNGEEGAGTPEHRKERVSRTSIPAPPSSSAGVEEVEITPRAFALVWEEGISSSFPSPVCRKHSGGAMASDVHGNGFPKRRSSSRKQPHPATLDEEEGTVRSDPSSSSSTFARQWWNRNPSYVATVEDMASEPKASKEGKSDVQRPLPMIFGGRLIPFRSSSTSSSTSSLSSTNAAGSWSKLSASFSPPRTHSAEPAGNWKQERFQSLIMHLLKRGEKEEEKGGGETNRTESSPGVSPCIPRSFADILHALQRSEANRNGAAGGGGGMGFNKEDLRHVKAALEKLIELGYLKRMDGYETRHEKEEETNRMGNIYPSSSSSRAGGGGGGGLPESWNTSSGPYYVYVP